MDMIVGVWITRRAASTEMLERLAVARNELPNGCAAPAPAEFLGISVVPYAGGVIVDRGLIVVVL